MASRDRSLDAVTFDYWGTLVWERPGELAGRRVDAWARILAAAGLAPERKHTSQGKGRNARRQFNELSFHALRHTATSWMKNAGISSAIVQDIIGHDSPAMSAHYTHIEESAKRRAIDTLPDLTGQ